MVDSDGSQRKVRTPKTSTNAHFGVGGTGAAANLATFFVSGDVPTMFGTRGNTRHVKCVCLDTFYMSGGERRLPNMNYMPILAWLSCSAEVRCMLLKYIKS